MLSPLREVFCVCVCVFSVGFYSLVLIYILFFVQECSMRIGIYRRTLHHPCPHGAASIFRTTVVKSDTKKKKASHQQKKKTRTKPHHFNQTNKQWFSLLHSTFVTQNLVSNGVIRVFKLLTLLVGTNQIFLCNTYLISCVGIVVDAVPK